MSALAVSGDVPRTVRVGCSGIADLGSGGAEYGPSFSGISVKAYLVSYDLNIMSLVLMLRLSGFLSQKWFFSDKPPAEA